MRTFAEGDGFGDYRVVHQLGKGGMGAVWLLRSSSGAKVAAKILDEESSSDHTARKRFLQEAELTIGLRHPNLVATYDVGEDPDTGLCYILMEYVPGGTLADRIKAHGPMRMAEAVEIVRSIAAVLEFGRRHGIVHRDIKPANIMFSADGTPKLADLGIARTNKGGSDTTTVTQTGIMIGTPAYMSPEQMIDSHHVDTRADIYSLGIVFFEMLAGERPNKDDTVIQLMARAVKGEPLPDIRTLRPEVPAALAQLLNMMVAPDKTRRISTPGQIVDAVDSINRTGKLETVKPHAQKPEAPAPSAEPRAGNGVPPWAALAAFVVVAVIAAAGMFALMKGMNAGKAASNRPADVVVKTVVRTNIVEKTVMRQAKTSSDGKSSAAEGQAKPGPRPDTAVAEISKAGTSDFMMRRRHRGEKPAPGWIAAEPNGTFDVTMRTNSRLSGDGTAERVICLYHPESNRYQDIRWYTRPQAVETAEFPETKDRYVRIIEKGRHLADIDKTFEFNVRCKKIKVDFSKIDGTVPYDKTTFEYKTYTRPWRSEDPGNVLISLTHPWIVEKRDGILAATGGADHIDYAYQAYLLVAREFSLSQNLKNNISATIKEKRCDAAGVAAVFVSLLRSAGIPARTMCGKGVRGKVVHCPEFYLEGCGWIPAGITRDAGTGEAKHFGVYDEQFLLFCSDMDVTVAGPQESRNHFERFRLSWWWIFSGDMTPCDTQFSWWMESVPEDAVAKRLDAAKSPVAEAPPPAGGKAETSTVFPILDRSPDAWAYSFEEEARWNTLFFDDSKWKRAPGGFGRKVRQEDLPGARMDTVWNTDRIFLRKRFVWNGGKASRAVADIYLDDDAAIWLNGRLLLAVNGAHFGWMPFEIPANRLAGALRKGENILCIEVRNRSQCQYFDCGLAVECGGRAPAHAGADCIRRVKTAEGVWTVVVSDGIAQIGDGRNVALAPRPKGKLKIPAELDGLAIRRIARDCFQNCTDLESVEIPEGVFSVGQGAFGGCTRLKTVLVPDTLEHFGIEALQYTALQEINLRNVRLLENGVFRGCGNLEKIDVARGNANLTTKNGVLYDKARRAIVFCPRSRKKYDIPNGIEEICACAFQRSCIRKAVIPKSVKFVGYCAFNECPALENVVFQGEDAIIGKLAFSSTPSLKSVTLPSHLKTLDEWAIFRNAEKLETVALPDTVEIVGTGVFEDCRSLKRVHLGKSLEKIGCRAFAQCVRLKSVSFPAALKELGAEVFLGCSGLKTVSFAGNAPALADLGNPIGGDGHFGHDLYREAGPSLVTLVPRTSTGWQANPPDGLPKKWPEGAGESARAIRYSR